MPTVTKTLVFASGAEGLADSGLSANIAFAYDGSTGNPSGCVKFTSSTNGLTSVSEKAKNPSTGETWESWAGVPAGKIVTAVEVTSYDQKSTNNFDNSGTLLARIVNSAGTTVHSSGDILSQAYPAGFAFGFGPGSGGVSRAVDSAHQASNTDIRLELEVVVTTSSSSAGFDLKLDNILLTITYSDPIVITAAPATAGLDIRLYDSNNKRKYLPPSPGSVNFEVLGQGGFGRGSFSLLSEWEDFILDGSEHVDIRIDGVFMYRGYVWIPERHIAGDGQTAQPELYGIAQRLGKYLVRRVYAYGAPVDLSVVAADIIADEVTITGRLPNMATPDIQTVGVELSLFDMRGQSVQSALDALSSLAPGLCIWGGGVDDTEPVPLDQIYFKPRPTTVLYRPSFGGHIIDFSYSPDLTEIVNSCLLTGGKVTHSNLVFNPSFENPAPNSETVGNLVSDYSLEAGGTGWTITGTVKTAPGDYPGIGRTGVKWLECDSAGEKGEPPIITGIDYQTIYTAAVWTRRENSANANTFTFEVEGLDTGNSVIQTVTISSAVDPGATSEYTRYSGDVDFSAHSSIVKTRLRGKSLGGTASNDGINFDDFAFYVKDGVGQQGWKYNLGGSATLSALDWAVKTFPAIETDPWHGGYGIAVTPAGIGSGADYVEIRQTQDKRSTLRASTPYFVTAMVRGKDAIDAISISIGVVEYAADGTVAATTEGPTMSATPYDSWHRERLTFTTNASTVEGEMFIRVRANVLHYLDGIMLIEGGAPANLDLGIYWEEETFEWKLNVESSVISFLLDADAQTSIDDHGLLEGTVSNANVTDDQLAQAFFPSYFNANAVPRVQGSLRLMDPSPLVKPDGKVRILNLPLPPAAFFPARIETTIDGSGSIIQVIEPDNTLPQFVDLLKLTEAKAVKAGQAVIL